jgi:hypothetical protein
VSPALLAGVILAVACLAYVLYPVVGPRKRRPRAPAANATAPRAVTDEEIEAAIRSFRETHVVGEACPVCGPRPESDVVFCSTCGRRLDGTAEAP